MLSEISVQESAILGQEPQARRIKSAHRASIKRWSSYLYMCDIIFSLSEHSTGGALLHNHGKLLWSFKVVTFFPKTLRIRSRQKMRLTPLWAPSSLSQICFHPNSHSIYILGSTSAPLLLHAYSNREEKKEGKQFKETLCILLNLEHYSVERRELM